MPAQVLLDKWAARLRPHGPCQSAQERPRCRRAVMTAGPRPPLPTATW